MMNDYIRSKHVEQTKKCGTKIDYKNCASRWSLTHCNMMQGTHNVKLDKKIISNHNEHIQIDGTDIFMISATTITKQFNLILPYGQSRRH